VARQNILCGPQVEKSWHKQKNIANTPTVNGAH